MTYYIPKFGAFIGLAWMALYAQLTAIPRRYGLLPTFPEWAIVASLRLDQAGL